MDAGTLTVLDPVLSVEEDRLLEPVWLAVLETEEAEDAELEDAELEGAELEDAELEDAVELAVLVADDDTLLVPDTDDDVLEDTLLVLEEVLDATEELELLAEGRVKKHC